MILIIFENLFDFFTYSLNFFNYSLIQQMLKFIQANNDNLNYSLMCEDIEISR